MDYHEDDWISNDIDNSELNKSVEDWDNIYNKVKNDLLNRLLDEILKKHDKH